MALLARKTEPPTRQEILDRLTLWRENLMEHDRGDSNCVLTRGEILRELDKWLDALNDRNGR